MSAGDVVFIIVADIGIGIVRIVVVMQHCSARQHCQCQRLCMHPA